MALLGAVAGPVLGLPGGVHHERALVLPVPLPTACACSLPCTVAAPLRREQACLPPLPCPHAPEPAFHYQQLSDKTPGLEPVTCPPEAHACWVCFCREEVKCRFCDGDLPDWKPVLTPAADEVAKALPTMSVTFNGQVRSLPLLAQTPVPGV